MISYNFLKNKTEKTFLDVEIVVDVNGKDICSFKLPSWRPGRYELQNFSQNVRDFNAKTLTGELLQVTKEDKDTWVVTTKGVETLQISYSYYARQMDAGGSWVDEDQMYINFINCAMLIDNSFDEPCTINLDVPENWEVAGALKNQGNILQANDYYELVDSPIIASPSLQKLTYSVRNTDFYLWFQGEIELQKERILRDFIQFTECQVELFGDFPTKEYHFLFQILPYRHYHGVEHAHSTVITLGPHYDFYSEKMYNDFLGVSSHELIHTWNVTRLRPKEMVPYNYFSENYFNTGFIAEGLTTYYGDYMLRKSGVFTMEQYIKELNGLLNRHFGNTGRKHASLLDSSVDLWLDGYKKGIPSRKVSIYVEGALTALVLDLLLRKESNGVQSLDTVMRKMWQKYATGGYTYAQYIEIVSEVAGKDMEDYFNEYIKGKPVIENSLKELLPFFGLIIQETQNKSIVEKRFGIKLQWQQDTLKVLDIDDNAPAAKTLEREDEIIAIDLVRPSQKFEAMFDQDKVLLSYFSHGKLKEITLEIDDKNYFTTYEIKENPNAGKTALQFKENWLGSKV